MLLRVIRLLDDYVRNSLIICPRLHRETLVSNKCTINQNLKQKHVIGTNHLRKGHEFLSAPDWLINDAFALIWPSTLHHSVNFGIE